MVRIYLFGGLRIENPATEPPKLSRKTRALLAYLATHGDTFSRSHLIDIFCRDVQNPAGSLRWHLSQLRRIDKALLNTQGQSVTLASDVWVDVQEFERAVASAGGLANAIALYEGEFLEGMVLGDAPAFELWLLGQRARTAQLFERSIERLADAADDENRLTDALQLTERQLRANPLSEKTHARMMRLYALTGQRDAALRQFEQCQSLLWDELAVAVSAETQALHAAIKTNQFDATHKQQPVSTGAKSLDRQPFELIGRSAELTQLHTLAASRQPQIVLVEALAGEGKTALLDVFLNAQSIKADAISRANCYDSARNFPYHPWLTLLESHINQVGEDALASLPDVWREQLAVLLPNIAPARTDVVNQQHLFRAVAATLFKLPRVPRILFIDDLHWADAASIELFVFVARHICEAQLPVLLIGSLRTEEVADNGELVQARRDLLQLNTTTRMRLSPFSAEQLTKLMAQSHTVNTATQLAAQLHAATGGNPLFATEILRELPTGDALPEQLPVPKSLRRLIERRQQQLSASSRQVLEALAVLGHRSYFELAQQVSARSEEETIAALEVGLRWRLLQDDDHGYRFRHALMREALLAQLSVPRRQRLHQRAAVALEQQGAVASLLTWHWGEAGNRPKQAHYALNAGYAAAKTYAVADAVYFFDLAANTTADQSTQMKALLALGKWLAHSGELDSAENTYKETLKLARTAHHTQHEADSLLGFGQLAVTRGLYDDALPHLQAALDRYQRLEHTAGILKCYNNLGHCAWWRGNYEEAHHHFQRQLDAAKSAHDLAQIASARRGLGLVDMRTGQLKQARTNFEFMLAAAESVFDLSLQARASGNIGLIHAQQGDIVTALSYWVKSVQILLEIDDKATLQGVVGNIGRAYGHFGQFDDALHCLMWQMELCLQMGAWQNMVICLTNVADVLSRLKQFDRCYDLLQSTVALATKLDIPAYLCAAECGLALICYEREQYQQAAQWGEAALARAADTQREDIEKESSRLLVLIRFRLTQDREMALTTLGSLMERWADTGTRAHWLYTLWQVDPSQTAAKKEAVALCQAAYEQGHSDILHTIYQKLTGDMLAPPPQLPTSPAPSKSPDRIADILTKVDMFSNGLL